VIAVHGEILAARRLPHHQEHHGRLVRTGHPPSVVAQALERHRLCQIAFLQIPGGAVHVVGRHYLPVQGLVVAPDRGVVLVVGRGDEPQYHQRGQHGEATLQQALIPFGRILYLDEKQQYRRHHSGQQYPDHNGHAQVGVSLTLVGLKDVLDHVAIKQHLVFHHGVAGNGTGD